MRHLNIQEELHADLICVRDQHGALHSGCLPCTPLLQPSQRGLRLPDLYIRRIIGRQVTICRSTVKGPDP